MWQYKKKAKKSNMAKKIYLVIIVLIFIINSNAQDNGGFLPGLSPYITPPTLNAKLTIGFNYDLLRSPTDVSFDYSIGYASFNFPLEQKNFIPQDMAEQIWDTVSLRLGQDMTSSSQFRPQAGARQFANSTIRVDVPMLKGVATFSNTQNVYINYLTILGNTNLILAYDTSINSNGANTFVKLFMRGAINVPIDATLGWETMTFGYAYKVNKDLVLAANLHRHIFRIDMLAKMDADLLGYFKVEQESQGGAQQSLASASLPKQSFDYTVIGEANGHYEAEAWSTTFGIKYWRFSLTSRFGIDTKARGYLVAKYSLPFFIDAKTFQPKSDITDPSKLLSSDILNAFQENRMDSVVYTTNEDATWKMPQGHTITFDIIPNGLSLSYTKIFGDIEAFHAHTPKDSSGLGKKYIDLDAAFTVDHIILISAKLYGAFINLGAFALDMRIGEEKNILGKAFKENKSIKWMMMGDAAMLPILNLGAAFGAAMKLGFELDVLPLPAFKLGVLYYF